MNWTYDADANPQPQTDGLNPATTYHYDNWNRLHQAVQQPNGDTTHYVYDALGKQASLTDGVSNTTSFTYDNLGRLVSDTNYLSQARTYTYDANGNRLTETDRDSRVRHWDYDHLNRPIDEKWLAGNGSSFVYTEVMAYDAAGSPVSIQDDNSDYFYGYDGLGRQVSVDNLGTPGSQHVVLVGGYDANGNRTSLIATINGHQDFRNAYLYDNLNRQTGVQQFGQTGNAVAEKRVDMTYDAGSQWETITRYKDLNKSHEITNSTYVYDADGRLTSLHYSAANVASYTWTYDQANRLTAVDNSLYNGEDTTYSYDDADQLTHSTATGESYTYDHNGNRSSGGTTIGADNRLLSDALYNYTYDAEGNLIQRETKTSGDVRVFSYDYRNRLIEVTDYQGSLTGFEAQDITYTYDAHNLRISRTATTYAADGGEGSIFSGNIDSQSVEHYVYDGQDVALDFTYNGLKTRYLYGQVTDQLLAQEDVLQDFSSDNRVLWLITDNLGSVRNILDNNNNPAVVAHVIYNSFGKIIDGSTSLTSNLFTGRELDFLTGLQYNRNRWYDPNTGRWLSQDPIGFAAGQSNLYEYVGNSPTIYVDPSGLFTANIEYNAFIPNTLGFKVANSPVAGVQWGWVPYQIFGTKAFATDNRATAGQAGTHRLQLSISVDTNQAGHLHGQLSSAGRDLSHQIRVYHANDLSGTKTYVPGSIASAPARVAHPLDKIYNQFSSTGRTSTVDAHASAPYPFGLSGVFGVPAIDLDLHIVIRIDCQGHGTIDVTGTNNKFPAYELIVNSHLEDWKYPIDPGPDIFNLPGSGSETLRYHKDF